MTVQQQRMMGPIPHWKSGPGVGLGVGCLSIIAPKNAVWDLCIDTPRKVPTHKASWRASLHPIFGGTPPKAPGQLLSSMLIMQPPPCFEHMPKVNQTLHGAPAQPGSGWFPRHGPAGAVLLGQVSLHHQNTHASLLGPGLLKGTRPTSLRFACETTGPCQRSIPRPLFCSRSCRSCHWSFVGHPS